MYNFFVFLYVELYYIIDYCNCFLDAEMEDESKVFVIDIE